MFNFSSKKFYLTFLLGFLSLFAGTSAHAQTATPLTCNDTSGSPIVQSCSTIFTIPVSNQANIIYSTTTTNTGDLTINVDGTGPAHVKKWLGQSFLAAGDIPANVSVYMIFDGTYWEVETIGNAPAAVAAGPNGTVQISNGSGGFSAGNANDNVTIPGAFDISENLNVTGTTTLLSLGTGAVCSFAGVVSTTNCNLYDVRSYGAKVDGSTVDTAAWTAAVAAASTAGGGVVWMPAGTSLSCQIALPSNVSIDANDRTGAILKLANGCNQHFIIPASASSTKNIAVNNITIDGNVANQTASGAFDCINWTNSGTSDRYFYMHHVTVQNCTEDGYNAASGAGNIHLVDVFFHVEGRYGLLIENDDTYLTDVETLTTGQTGMRVLGANVYVTNGSFNIAGSNTPSNGDGVYTANARLVCSPCSTQDNYRNGFFTTGSSLQGTLFADGNGRASISGNAYGLADDGMTASNIAITCTDHTEPPNFPSTTQQYCVHMTTGTNNTIIGQANNQTVGNVQLTGTSATSNTVIVNGVGNWSATQTMQANMNLNNSGSADNVIDWQTAGTSEFKLGIPSGSASFYMRDFTNSFNFGQYFPTNGNLYLSAEGTGTLILNAPVSGTGGGTGGVQISSGGSSPTLWEQFNANIATSGHLNQITGNNDIAGIVTITNPATTNTFTFATPFSGGPTCTLGNTADTTSVGSVWYTTTASILTIHVHTTPSSTIAIAYHCIGNPN